MKKYRLYQHTEHGATFLFEGREIHKGYVQENARYWAITHNMTVFAEELGEDGEWHYCGMFYPEITKGL